MNGRQWEKKETIRADAKVEMVWRKEYKKISRPLVWIVIRQAQRSEG
jgi:hypothetical protein